MADENDGSGAQYASPPCFMHELDPAFQAPLADWSDVRRWRKAERERLIQSRLAVSADTRSAMASRIADGLDALIGDVAGKMVSLYWPFRGEPDLRPWMQVLQSAAAQPRSPSWSRKRIRWSSRRGKRASRWKKASGTSRLRRPAILSFRMSSSRR